MLWNVMANLSTVIYVIGQTDIKLVCIVGFQTQCKHMRCQCLGYNNYAAGSPGLLMQLHLSQR